MVTHVSNLSTWEPEAGGCLLVQGLPSICSSVHPKLYSENLVSKKKKPLSVSFCVKLRKMLIYSY